MKLLRVLILLAAAVAPGTAFAAAIPLLSGPQDVSQLNTTLNNLILQINLILTPLTGGGPTNSSQVNNISLSGGTTGNPAVIGLQPGGDSNGSIQILPDQAGNIVLFNSTSTGVLQIANVAGFASTQGLAGCPAAAQPIGVPPLKRTALNPLGVSATITGYFIIQDWLGRSHGVPAC